MALLKRLSISLVLAASSSHAAMQLTGTTINIDDVSYWVPPTPSGQLDPDIAAQFFNTTIYRGYVPFTVVVSNSTTNPEALVEQELSRFLVEDDVWAEQFSTRMLSFSPHTYEHYLTLNLVVYLQVNNGQPETSGAIVSMEALGKQNILLQKQVTGVEPLPIGPYFLSAQGEIHRAYRLYADTQGSFIESIYADLDGSHSVLPAHVPGPDLAIAVPSRLYYDNTPEKPLAGLRLGIKDIYDVAGIKTGNGNRAWYHLYPPANATAPAVQRLVDAGAVIVGKQKTAQFANGEYANSDWIDYQAPFNPRGDGYQDPNFSSAGAGAGIASYEWLDLALGSDTGGSTRGPARVQGLYGMRPSWGSVAMDETLPLAPEFDTAGLIARDAEMLRQAAQAVYGLAREPDARGDNSTNATTRKYPTELLVEAFPSGLSSETLHTLNSFLDGLCAFLGAQETVAFNITQSWDASRPVAAPERLQDMLNITYITLVSQRQASLVRDPFYADYAGLHAGRLPFVNPVPQVRWTWGDQLPGTASDEALRNSTIFRDWFGTTVLAPDDVTCSSSILAYHSAAVVQYRDAYRDPPTIPYGFTNQYYSVFSHAPDLVVPGSSSPLPLRAYP